VKGVDALLADAALRDPAKTALVAGSRRISYAELNRRAEHIAARLRDCGVTNGDRVAVSLGNSPENVAAIFGILRAGAAFCPISLRAPDDKLAWIVNHCRATAIIAEGRALAAATALGTLTAIDGSESALDPPDDWCAQPFVLHVQEPTERLAAVIYTSGSTGRPKGVMLSHANILAATESIVTYLENTNEDVILCVLPLAFSYGLSQVFTCVLSGATLVLEPSFAFPPVVLETMRREKATGFALVPTIAAMLARNSEIPGAQGLRYVTNAGAALPVPHVKALKSLLPNAKIYSMHGLTECIRTVYLHPDEIEQFPDSVGRAIPGVQIAVVGPDDHPVPPGVTGEMVVAGPTVMLGYWDDIDATNAAMRRGPDGQTWLHSGDLFRTDEEGRCYFVARSDDIIKTRGEKVSPREVENVLHELPQVKHAVVVGVPDNYLGHVLKALIVPWEPDTLTTRDVLKHCAKRLEEYMVPKFVEFRDELPVTDSNKIIRRALTDRPKESAT